MYENEIEVLQCLLADAGPVDYETHQALDTAIALMRAARPKDEVAPCVVKTYAERIRRECASARAEERLRTGAANSECPITGGCGDCLGGRPCAYKRS